MRKYNCGDPHYYNSTLISITAFALSATNTVPTWRVTSLTHEVTTMKHFFLYYFSGVGVPKMERRFPKMERTKRAGKRDRNDACFLNFFIRRRSKFHRPAFFLARSILGEFRSILGTHHPIFCLPFNQIRSSCHRLSCHRLSCHRLASLRFLLCRRPSSCRPSRTI